MTFKQLIRRNQWDEVKAHILAAYPDQIEVIHDYEYLLCKFHTMQEIDSKLTIFFEKRKCEGTQDCFVDVKGKFETLSKDGNPEIQYTIMEFTPWYKWLGSEIDPDTLKDYSESQIIAHCLWEMTFMGWEEEEIDSKMEDMVNIVNSMLAENQNSSEET